VLTGAIPRIHDLRADIQRPAKNSSNIGTVSTVFTVCGVVDHALLDQSGAAGSDALDLDAQLCRGVA
jgi:hypothetical protein